MLPLQDLPATRLSQLSIQLYSTAGASILMPLPLSFVGPAASFQERCNLTLYRKVSSYPLEDENMVLNKTLTGENSRFNPQGGCLGKVA